MKIQKRRNDNNNIKRNIEELSERELLLRKLELKKTEEKLQGFKDKMNPVYIPLLEDTSRFLVLIGGGGSGKSVFGSQKMIYRYRQEKGQKCVVIRKIAGTLRDSIFSELKKAIYTFGIEDEWDMPKGRGGDANDLFFKHKTTGSEFLFRGLDDVEKIKSIEGITDMLIEEASELDHGDINQLDIRMRAFTNTYSQMVIMFNPISITHFLKIMFFDKFIPTLESGKIYKYKYNEFFDEENRTNIIQYATVLHTTYKHNQFLSVQQIGTLEGFKEKDPYYYDVYCLGLWGVIGKIVFDSRLISARILKLREKAIGTSGRFERDSKGLVRFVKDDNGFWIVYKEPKKYVKYCIGADVAEGNEWGDYNACHVMDVDTKEQVATFHGHVDVDVYAEELEAGGNYFNNALLNPEVNFNPGLVLNLERRHYPKIYMRQVTNTITKGLQNKYGWRTDKYNRQGMIADLVEFVRDYCYLLNDIATLEEMLTFVRDTSGKPQAQEGKHDDLVMSLAIALQTVMSGQAGLHSFDQQIDISKLSQDMQDDYYKADKYTKKYLIKKWGLAYKELSIKNCNDDENYSY